MNLDDIKKEQFANLLVRIKKKATPEQMENIEELLYATEKSVSKLDFSRAVKYIEMIEKFLG